jgi:hypothetical protein
MAIFKTGGNFKSITGHFYINFEYKTHLNFGGNFSKKKVSLIVRKIRYMFQHPIGPSSGYSGGVFSFSTLLLSMCLHLYYNYYTNTNKYNSCV